MGGVEAAELTVPPGVVVKFGPDAGMVVRDTLHTGAGVIFTSSNDDSAGGQTSASPGVAQAGDWRGVTLGVTAVPSAVTLDGLMIRYAGAGNAAALSFERNNYRFDALDITDSTIGMRITGGGSAALTGAALMRNGVGLVVDGNATPSITGSHIAGNSGYGVQNLTPAGMVQATGNWWGAASGPLDTANNPAGQGDRVTAGVNYGQYRTAAPLVGCRISPVNDSYYTTTRIVQLDPYCPNATEYRLSEVNTFAGATYAPLISPVSFTLSAAAGSKTLYAQYRSADGQTVIVATPQAMVYAPQDPPTVSLTAPAEGATIITNATISATASDASGISKVAFYVDDTLIAIDTSAPYSAQWIITGYADGPHTLKAVATNTLNISASAMRVISLSRNGGDLSGPTLAATFNGSALADGVTLTQTGLLGIAAGDPAGVQGIRINIDGGADIANFVAGGATATTQSTVLTFDAIADGAHTLNLIATDKYGNTATSAIAFTLALAAPAAPVITSPVNNALVQNRFSVNGTAAVGSRVQIYVDGVAAGGLIGVGSSGSFSGNVTLTSDGSHVLTADARNARATSAQSTPVNVSYAAPAPSVSFVSPAEGAKLSAAPTVSLSAVDSTGVSSVVLYVDDVVLATFTQPPYSTVWDVSAVADGSHTLKAVATNTMGKTATVTRGVTVQKVVVVPPVITPYTGELNTVAPQTSYGTQPIVISGRAVDRTSGAAVANAALRVVLTVQGYARRIGIATDATGAFTYNFVPQASDAGTYSVSVIHPDETSFHEQGRFTINRVSFNLASYALTAARGFPSSIPISAYASAGTGVTGLRWVAVAADQPGGSLPPGISVEGGTGINIAAGASAPMSIRFTADAAAGETGTVIFTAFATDSGSVPRGRFTLNYRLVEARPALFASPTYIETGVQQGKSVSAAVTLGNRGLVAATNVKVRITDAQGNAAPAWAYLASAGTLGTVDVGASIPLQITASPDESVPDGIYNLKLQVSADNDVGGTVPIAVSVTQSGAGNVTFDVADIYTATLDANLQPIPGVAGASIKLQNEHVLTWVQNLTTGADGTATVSDIPPGIYLYRVSAPNHSDKSGRIQVLPGVTLKEHVFLDYNIVNISFNVTETTIKDQYDLTITSTFNTQVPAPVVLLEPMSVNLPDLQVGEEFTGELTLTNYGTLEAQGVTFTPPPSDAYYRYEFFGEVPSVLPPKTRVTLPYRVTALQLQKQGLNFKNARHVDPNSVIAKALDLTSTKVTGACSSYSTAARSGCYWTCASGDQTSSNSNAVFSHIAGASCGGTPGGGSGSGGVSGGGTGTGGFGGSTYSPGAVPLAPTCTPRCVGKCCSSWGGGGGGGGGGSGGGGPGVGDGGGTPIGVGSN